MEQLIDLRDCRVQFVPARPTPFAVVTLIRSHACVVVAEPRYVVLVVLCGRLGRCRIVVVQEGLAEVARNEAFLCQDSVRVEFVLVHLLEARFEHLLLGFLLHLDVLHLFVQAVLWLILLDLHVYIDFEQLFAARQVSTDDRPLLEKLVLDLQIASVHVEELKRLRQIALLFDEYLCIEYFIELPV